MRRHVPCQRLQCGQRQHSGSAPRLRDRRIDPGGGGFAGRGGRLVDEALRVVAERLIECGLTCGMDGIGLAVMHLVRGHQADAGMVVVLVVPIEEVAAEGSGVLDAAEALRELRLVFQRLEVAFGERVVPRLRRGRLLDTYGRLWDRVTPRSASSSAVAPAFAGAGSSPSSVHRDRHAA